MSNLKSVLKYWSDFNLPVLQKSLDQSANEIVERQENSEKGKKLLIKLTKEWKASSSEEVRSKASPVIKAFQKEIDSLNSRSKAAESSFLLLYKNLLEIPDPVPVLKQAESMKKQLDKAKDLELENQQLRTTLEEYNTEFADVKNQEITLNKLKEKLKKYEEQTDEKLKALLDEKEKALQISYNEREQKLLDSKLLLATKLGDSEAKIKTLKEELEKTQGEIFELKSRHDEEITARISEMEILESDLERANQQLLAAEKFSENFKSLFNQDTKDAADGLGQQNEVQYESMRAMEFQLLSKERELSDLMEEIHHQQSVADKFKRTVERELALAEGALEKKSKEVNYLNQKLNSMGDYEEIKRELQVLKLIEFPGLKEDENELSIDVKPLEKLLLEKNKSLQSECTKLKVQNGELTGKYDQLQKSYSEVYRTVNDQKELISQLETDIMNVKRLSSNDFTPTSTITSEAITKAVEHLHADEFDEMDKQTVESLLPIVSSQRERFRLKNLELESQSRHQQYQISMLQNEVDSVRQDNVKLYEKIKFLQSYPNKNNLSMKIDDDSTQRYSNSYEERIDPFNDFSRKEKLQRYSNLSTPEKITLNMTRFILSNKVARTLVFFYTIILHCLVFLVLYKFAYTESCKDAMLPFSDYERILKSSDKNSMTSILVDKKPQ
ncbi:protein CASP-like isoform X1 [Hydra vulgaris]|uniref:Protein CASP n=1 Tax=Hydra vulgaris TaxID=6087 RepID=T2MD01_HYDVU|nr:protein CASP-like [Hydra vulgaris]